MATDIQRTEFGCNDQAMHQHIYYTGLLATALTDAGLGNVVAVENEKSEIGTIGYAFAIKVPKGQNRNANGLQLGSICEVQQLRRDTQ